MLTFHKIVLFNKLVRYVELIVGASDELWSNGVSTFILALPVTTHPKLPIFPKRDYIAGFLLVR